jgi:hypothetical protein
VNEKTPKGTEIFCTASDAEIALAHSGNDEKFIAVNGLILDDNPLLRAVRDCSSEVSIVALEISRHEVIVECVLVSSLPREVVEGLRDRLRWVGCR